METTVQFPFQIIVHLGTKKVIFGHFDLLRLFVLNLVVQKLIFLFVKNINRENILIEEKLKKTQISLKCNFRCKLSLKNYPKV